MAPYIYLLLAVTAEVIGTSALKASFGMTKLLPTLTVILSYSLAFWSLSISLKTLPVGVVYAIWAGLGIICIMLIGVVYFEEKFTFLHLIGTTLIISGVILLTLLTH